MLSRVGRSGLAAAQTLLTLIILTFVGSQTVVIGIDETLERQWCNRIWWLGIEVTPRGKGTYRSSLD